MPSNNSNNSIKHKFDKYTVTFSKLLNKWVAKIGEKRINIGTFKECRKYCKINP